MRMKKERYKSGLILKKIRMLAAICLVVLGGCTLINRAASARIRPVDPIVDKGAVQWIPAKGDPDSLLVQLKRGHSKGLQNTDSRQRAWEQLTPEEKAQYLKRYQQLQNMSPKERKKYEKMHQQWQKLSPEERRQIRSKLKGSQELSPQELDTLRRRFKN